MKVFPFKGVLFNPDQVADFSQVLTQPYDKINADLQSEYHRRHQNNYVRIIKDISQPEDNDTNNIYTRAARNLELWLSQGVLKRDATPSIYVYHQVTDVPGCGRMRRKAFIAAAQLEDFSQGGVHPHETTHAGPKADRLKLALATGSHTGPIFMLYDEKENRINEILDQAIADLEPDIRTKDDFASDHELWRVTRPDVLKQVADLMADAPALIADGHHRYETALNYRNLMRKKGKACSGADSFENALVAFVNLHDPALVIYPSHRLLFNLEQDKVALLIDKASAWFDIEDISLDMLKERLNGSSDKIAFGLYSGKDKAVRQLTLRDPKIMEKLAPAGFSSAWKSLDVAVLHTVLLEHLLGVTADDLEHERNVRYARYIDEATAEVDAGLAQLGFLLNSTKVSQVKEIALAGEKMPQKSTDFFPKLLSGLVLLKMDFK